MSPDTHPNDERLIAYANDELRRVDVVSLVDHLVGCSACAGTVARYRLVRDFVRADVAFSPSPVAVSRAKALFLVTPEAPARDFFAPLRRIIAELVFDSGGGFAPALAGFRGAGDRHMTYEAEQIEIDVQVTPAASGENLRLLGQIAADRELGWATLELLPTGGIEVVATTTSDEYGVFEVQVPAGTYEVVARFPGVEVVVPNLELD